MYKPTSDNPVPPKLSARQREQQKTRREKQEDVANLISHTFLCFLTDAPSMALNSWVEKNVTAGFDKDTRQAHFNVDFSASKDSTSVGEALKDQFHPNNIGCWLFGEGIGDIVAIPATIAVQRFAPEVMDVLEKPLEGMFGGVYRQSAEARANRWADKHNIMRGSEEYLAYQERHYRKDMERLPQTFVWSAISMVAGALAQQHIAPLVNEQWREEKSFNKIILSSVLGKAVTGVAANAPRVLAPELAEKGDHFVREHIAEPTTEIFEHILGTKQLESQERHHKH